MRVQSLGWEDPLAEGMATHSSILAWRIPWTEEPGGLGPRVAESDMTKAAEQACMHWGAGYCLYNCYKMLYNPLIGLEYSKAQI